MSRSTRGSRETRLAVPSPTVLQDPPEPKDTARLLLVLALALVAISYLNTLGFNFVYDDFPQLVNNARVHSWQHAPKLFAEQVWTQSMLAGTGNYYRPIFELWLLVQYSLFGLHPGAYHLVSVILHIGVVGLVYLLFQRLTSDRLTASMGAVLFAVHPTHIETVAWISGATDLLCALFAVASFLAYLNAREENTPSEKRIAWLIAAVGLYGLSMMSKETAVVLPALLLVYEWSREQKDALAAQTVRILPFVAITGVYLFVRHWVLLGFMHPEPYPLKSVALTMPQVLWFYAHHLVWPFNLSVFYDSWFLDKPGWWDFYLPMAGVMVFAAAIFFVARRSRTAVFGAAWMLATLAPALVAIYVFIPEELVHDRYLYLPSIGFALILAVAFRQLKSNGHLLGGPRLQMAAVLSLGGVLAAGTAAQNIYWSSDVILFAQGMKVAPHNVLAVNHMANEMFKRNKPDVSIALYHRALDIKPKQWQTHFALGITLYELGHYAEAIRALEQAVVLAPENGEQFYFLGLSQLGLGDNAHAEQTFEQGLRRNPKRPGMNNALATALLRQGKTEQAKQSLRAEIELTHDRNAIAELQELEKR